MTNGVAGRRDHRYGYRRDHRYGYRHGQRRGGALVAVALGIVCLSVGWLDAQTAGGRATQPVAPREAAPIDLTGMWVSVITEDWKFRMVTPAKGVYETLTLNAEGRKVGDSWDPARDEAAGDQCRAYGAGNIMRMPGRVRVAWRDGATLQLDTDAGTQTRLLHFDRTAAAPAEATWQGHSVASWSFGPGGRGEPNRGGSLKVVTTRLRPGYVRKNGAPYSDRTTVTEYFDVNEAPNGDRWLTVTTKVDDPVYFTRPYLTSSDFKRVPNGAGWNPTPCSSR